MEAEILAMSRQEQDRSEVIRLHIEGHIKQKEVSMRLGLSTRQVRNLTHVYRLNGAASLIHGATVTVCEDFQGNVTLLYKGKVLTYETWKRGEAPPAIRDSKEINQAVDQAIRSQDQRKAWKPAPDHPWRKLELGHTQKRKFLSGTKPEISTLG